MGGVFQQPARRKAIITKLQETDLRVQIIEGVYGEGRDKIIEQSKLVVNIGFHDAGYLEMVRLSYLINNDIAIVSEISDIAIIDPELRAALQPVKYDELVNECVRLANDDTARIERVNICAKYYKTSSKSMASNLHTVFQKISGTCDWLAPIGENNSEYSIAARSVPEYYLHSKKLNICAMQQYLPGWVNTGLSMAIHCDWVVDLSNQLPYYVLDIPLGAHGRQKIRAGHFEIIRVNQILQCERDILIFMKNCLDLLCEDGELHITVPYDLSYKAWEHPKTQRAFNEKSFDFYCIKHWDLNWMYFRFEQIETVHVLGDYGAQLQKEGIAIEDIIRRPRAVVQLQVKLKKRQVSEFERLERASKLAK